MTTPSWLRSASWWLGLLVVVNLYLVPSSGSSPRGTDVLGAGLAVWILVRAHRRGVRAMPLAALGVANILPIVWLVLSVLDGGRSTTVLAARWLLALPWAIALVELTRNPREMERFAWGLLVGCGLNVAGFALQYVGAEGVLKVLGMSSEDQDKLTWVGKQSRLPGLHRHYNASAAVTSLIVPPALWLYLRGRAGLWLPLVALGGLAFALHVSFTRSPLVVVAVTIAFALAASRDPKRSVTLGATLAAVAIPALLVIGPPGGWLRWVDTAATETNAAERFRSTWVGFTLGLENPLGLGEREARARVADQASLSAVHNAFVQVGMVFGLPLAALMLLAFVHLAWGGFEGASSSGYLLALLAVHMAGLFVFEEHLSNPTFLVLVSWCIAASADRIGLVPVTDDEAIAA